MRIAFIGLGEAASAFISGWGGGRDIRAFDTKTRRPETAAEIAERARRLGINACDSPAEALSGADLVFSTVTADQAIAAATDYAPFLESGSVWCDLNSCAPKSKQTSQGIVEGAGARYLDVAVMAPVHPKLNMVPCLLSGPAAAEFAPVLADLPMSVRVVGADVGRASSIKMVRSIMVKGLEALTAECTLAAVAAGVEADVFPSLKSGHPNIDVPERAAYNFERSMAHGERRAAELEEVAKMLTDLGLPNAMALGTAQWERRLAQTGIPLPDDADALDYMWFSSRLLRALGVDTP